MTRSTCFFTAALVLWIGGQVVAQGPSASVPQNGPRPTGCAAAPCCCPDDYCRKPLPCVPCGPLRWLCDDYCRKSLPCVPCQCLGVCPDDYCRKPCPDLCRPLDRQFYRCPPPDCPVTDCQPRRCLWR